MVRFLFQQQYLNNIMLYRIKEEVYGQNHKNKNR